jgi:membrane protease YdiL (CAAX protease family)
MEIAQPYRPPATPPTVRKPSSLSTKTIALLEVVGVLTAGTVAAYYLMSRLNLKPPGAVMMEAFQTTAPDLTALSIDWLKATSLQYFCLLVPAFGIGWFRCHHGLRDYGITTAGKSLWYHAGLGLLTFAVVALPLKFLWIAKEFLPLGPEPPVWQLLNQPWTLSLWICILVTSCTVTAAFEELLYRGYCQSRLEEDFGGIGAIFIVAIFFSLGHDQYRQLSILNVGMILTLLLNALGMGYVYWRSRSLLAGTILHGALNLPTKGIYNFILPALMLAALIIFRPKLLRIRDELYQESCGTKWKRTAFPAAAVVLLLLIGVERRGEIFVPVVLAGFAVALFSSFRGARKTAS